MAIFLRLLRLLRPHWGAIGLGILLLLVAAPCELFPALVWKYVTDDLIMRSTDSPTEALAWLFSFGGRLQGWPALLGSALAWMLVIYAIGETLGTLSNYVMQKVAQRFILSFRNEVYHKLQTQSLSYLQRQRTGELMSRAMGDVDELQSFIVNGIDVILGEGVLWLATVGIVFAIDWLVASVTLAPLMLVYVLLRVFNKRIAPIYRAAREKAAEVSARLQENLTGVVVIKIFGREKAEADRFRRTTEESYTQQMRAIRARSLYFPFTRGVGFLSNVTMIGVGTVSILKGWGCTLGDLVAFRAYWWRLFGPVQTLARVNDMIQRAAAAGRRVFEVLDAPDELPDAPDAIDVPQVRGRIALENVTFAYGESPVLHEMSLVIEPGTTVALCGPSGSGKSTILNLILRFYDPRAGRVTLDVQQETFLFNESVLENIRYGHGEATMEQIVAAARAANAHEFIENLPEGYNTIVGERGVKLSGGQKQRLSIARAFLTNPTILLLDEPTSSVEPDSEAAIIAALDRLMAGRTTVVTSHRPSLIRQADVVYVIEHGRIVESGAVEEVVRRHEWFARFMQSDAPLNGETAAAAE
jgi:ABC-type multidrug transport system fused ATPase/permease subunit